MPISVLHLLGSAQPEGSGIARIVTALAAGLDRSKYNVHAWFLGPPGPLIEDLRAAGATSRSINWRRGVYDPIGAYRFWRCLQNHDFAIVHQHHGARSIRRLIRLSSDACLVVQLHGHISDPIFPHRAPVAVRGADVVIAVSLAGGRTASVWMRVDLEARTATIASIPAGPQDVTIVQGHLNATRGAPLVAERALLLHAFDPADFSAPLKLLAQRLEFDDPITGAHRCFVSSRGVG